MKKIKLKCYIIFFFFITSNLYSKNFLPITILTEEWPPYNYTENNKLKGFSYEVVKYIMEDLKMEEEILVLPGMRGIKILETRSRVMFFSLFRTPERELKYKWIGPISKDSFYFYKKKNSSLKIDSLEDAKRVNRISTRSQGLVYNYLKKMGFKNLDVSIDGKSIYRKVITGRNDLAIGDSSVGVVYLLKSLEQPIDILEKTQLSVLNYDLYIAASKDISDMEIALWQKSLNKMIKNGAYDIIYKKYMK